MDTKQAAGIYLNRGWQPCPLGKPGTKAGKEIKTKGWRKKKWTPDDFTEQNNLGLILGKASGGLVALDFDCDTTRALADVESLLPITWMDGRGGRISHAYYETGETVGKKQTFRLYLKKHPNAMAALGVGQQETFTFIELLADGQQVMAYPSIHPSGELVKWTKTPGTKSPNHVPFDNVVKDAGLLSFMAAVIMTYPDGPGSRDETCMALTGAFIKAGYVGPRADFLVETVARLAGDDEWETRGKASGTAEKMAAGEAATGMTRLCEMLGLIEIQDLLRDWLQVEATPVEADAPSGDWLEEFNEQYFIVGEGEGFVYEKVWHRTLKREVLKKQSQTNFVRRHAHRTQMVGKRPMNVAALWLVHPQAVRYDRMVFAPGEPLELKGHRGSLERNIWTGWACDPVKGNMHESLLRHICENICLERWEDRELAPHYQYVIKWLASRVQFPDRPAYVALLLKGPPGTGKSFMAKYVGKLFGTAYLHSGNAEHTTSNFNVIFRSKLLVCVEEFFADVKGMNVIMILPELMDTKIRTLIISVLGGAHHGQEKKSIHPGVQA